LIKNVFITSAVLKEMEFGMIVVFCC